MPGDEVWIIGERRATGERKYYISNLPAHTTLKLSQLRSKPGGYANRPTSSSKRNLASTTSKAGHGRDYTDTA